MTAPGSCSNCCREWEPDTCAFCGEASLRYRSFAELLYEGNDVECHHCQEVYNTPDWEAEDAGTCPKCGYPVIPELDEDELLLYMAEQHIPRDERGVHLTAHMLAWLKLWGIKKRPLQRELEEIFFTISSSREAANADRMAKARARASEGNQE